MFGSGIIDLSFIMINLTSVAAGKGQENIKHSSRTIVALLMRFLPVSIAQNAV